jgi:hypothetical protein
MFLLFLLAETALTLLVFTFAFWVILSWEWPDSSILQPWIGLIFLIPGVGAIFGFFSGRSYRVFFGGKYFIAPHDSLEGSDEKRAYAMLVGLVMTLLGLAVILLS